MLVGLIVIEPMCPRLGGKISARCFLFPIFFDAFGYCSCGGR